MLYVEVVTVRMFDRIFSGADQGKRMGGGGGGGGGGGSFLEASITLEVLSKTMKCRKKKSSGRALIVTSGCFPLLC